MKIVGDKWYILISLGEIDNLSIIKYYIINVLWDVYYLSNIKLCKGANVKLLGFIFFLSWKKKKIGTFLGTQTKKRI